MRGGKPIILLCVAGLLAEKNEGREANLPPHHPLPPLMGDQGPPNCYFRAARSAAWLNATVVLAGRGNDIPPAKPTPNVTGCLSAGLLRNARRGSRPPGGDRA